jgi:hypothetical protein
MNSYKYINSLRGTHVKEYKQLNLVICCTTLEEFCGLEQINLM